MESGCKLSFLLNLPTFTHLALSVGNWNIRFSIECIAEVASRTLTAEAPTYSTIMELDRKVREFPLWEDAIKTASSEVPDNLEGMSPAAAMTLCVMSHAREVSECSRPFVLTIPT